MTDKQPRRSSGGMYDPARDSWGDTSRSGDRDESPRPQRDSDHAQPLGDRAGVDSPAAAAAQEPANGPSLTRKLDTQDPVRHHEDSYRATLTSPSTAIPAPEHRPEAPEPTRKRSQPASKQTPPDPKMTETPPSSEAPPTAPDSTVGQRSDAIASPGTAQTTQPQNAPPGNKRKVEDESAPEKPQPASDRPVTKRKRVEERSQKLRKPARAPPSAYARRDRTPPRESEAPKDEPPQKSPSPPPRPPTPDAQARQRKRPGGGSRMGIANREILRQRQEERERAQEEGAMQTSRSRGLTDVVRQHYNAVPERGREWRKTESKIRGLRSFNNWVKSTLIQKFSPDEEFISQLTDTKDWADDSDVPQMGDKRLLVLDLGCGKGGDLGKWQLAPQTVDLYVGLDPAEISIVQARDRYHNMRTGRGSRGRRNPVFYAEFFPMDCFGQWLGDIPIIQQVGVDPSVGPGGSMMSARWGGGGFDVVSSMFAIHYAFESEQKTRQMLCNVAGSLRKGGRFLGVCPNSDVISSKVAEFNQTRKKLEAAKKAQNETPEDGEVEEEDIRAGWGNSLYRVRFPGATPEDGVFRPPFGWRYSYFMEEAVEEIPEYVVPWEAFRALTEDYNLELQYRKPFLDIWRDEKNDRELGPLSERMGVRDAATGELRMSEEEQEAASFYHAFCFYKV